MTSLTLSLNITVQGTGACVMQEIVNQTLSDSNNANKWRLKIAPGHVTPEPIRRWSKTEFSTVNESMQSNLDNF